MEPHVQKTLFCILLVIYRIVGQTFDKFQAVDVFEGYGLLEKQMRSVYGCVLDCRLTTACRGTSYNVAREECQLLGKDANVPTQFGSNATHLLHMEV